MTDEDEEDDYFYDADEIELPSNTDDSDNENELAKKLPRIKPRERRPTKEEMKENREFLLANPQYFITMKPMVEAYSLTTNEWSTTL